jgi:hypothetical protein
VFITSTDVVVVEVDGSFLIAGEIRFPRSLVQRAEVVSTLPLFAEVVSTLPLFADVVVHTTAGDAVRLQGLLRSQAPQFADCLRP